MDWLTSGSSLISSSYLEQGQQALQRRKKLFRSLLSERRLPADGWDDPTIELFLQEVASMDSNNFLDNVGVGEREARLASGLVARRHFGLAHGIGRSGDIAAEQPKAAGSSLLAKLTNLLAKDALRIAGFDDLGTVSVIPVATGMAITLTMLALKTSQPSCAKYVLWPRVDQKTCLKSLVLAGVNVIPVAMSRQGDELCTDMEGLQAKIRELGADNVLAVVTTTSCFAPRAADNVVAVAKLCSSHGIGHIINNAYGVQARQLTQQITTAWRRGRVDAVIQSTDKNFMVPVGGAVVCAGSSSSSIVDKVSQSYPGRASMAPGLDLLITLLHWGASGWSRVLQEREQLMPRMLAALCTFAEEHGEHVLNTPGNPISMAMTLGNVNAWWISPAQQPAHDLNNNSASRSHEQPRLRTAMTASASVPGSQGLSDEQSKTQAAPDQPAGSSPQQSASAQVCPACASHTTSTPVAGSLTAQEPYMESLHKHALARAGHVTPPDGALDLDMPEENDPHQPADASSRQLETLAQSKDRPSDACEPAATHAGPNRSQATASITFLGSKLFSKCVSGTRVIAQHKTQTVAGHIFQGYGSHCDDFGTAYLTAAAALGTTIEDVHEFLRRLGICMRQFSKSSSK